VGVAVVAAWTGHFLTINLDSSGLIEGLALKKVI
jgi:hypothetical protein